MQDRIKDKLLTKIFPRLLIAYLLSLLLAGCVTSGGRGWPIETYNYTCDTGMIPREPICLTWTDYDGGFKYSDQFPVCKQSMMNFTNALDEYYRCADTKLTEIFDKLLISVPATYNCYVEFFKDKDKGDPSSECPPVDIPRYRPLYVADGLEINLGVPQCIAKSIGYNFAPNDTYQLDDCRKQVDVFIGKSRLSHSIYAASAQDQYDTYLGNLKWILNQKADNAVNKFNCIAERRRFCI